MAKELRGPWPTLEARRPRRTHPAFAIPPGSMVADWEKFSAKKGNRAPHRSPKASDRWHPHLGAEKRSRPGHRLLSRRTPRKEPLAKVHAIPGARKRGTWATHLCGDTHFSPAAPGPPAEYGGGVSACTNGSNCWGQYESSPPSGTATIMYKWEPVTLFCCGQQVRVWTSTDETCGGTAALTSKTQTTLAIPARHGISVMIADCQGNFQIYLPHGVLSFAE